MVAPPVTATVVPVGAVMVVVLVVLLGVGPVISIVVMVVLVAVHGGLPPLRATNEQSRYVNDISHNRVEQGIARGGPWVREISPGSLSRDRGFVTVLDGAKCRP
jgi:hypothetical protein